MFVFTLQHKVSVDQDDQLYRKCKFRGRFKIKILHFALG